MAQDNAQIVREAVAALNEAYASDDVAPWRRHVERWVDPDGVLEGGADVFTEGEWRGQEGAIAFGGQARHTSIPVELHPFHAVRLRDGRAIEWRIFTTRAEALEALDA
jgi:hypothetical protein